jgi:hypothetical protein
MRHLFLITFLLAAPAALPADRLKPPAIFSDHMVLQRGRTVPVWGEAKAGENVVVEFAGQKKTATADANGKWLVKLDPLATSAEPRDLKVGATVFRDVLVGEVWLCSGQSNMGLPMSKAKGGRDAIAKADLPRLRMFRVKQNPRYEPGGDVLVENVTGAASGTCAIRLLPGVKRFDDGTELDCPLENITLRRITDIREFKIYDQPNLEMGRDKDFSIGVGSIRNLRFENLVFNRPGKIELHANTDGLVIQGVEVNHPIAEDWQLLAIGPKSQTWNRAKDPARWTEIFSPDLDCTVRNVTISGVRARDSQTDLPIARVVKVIEQKLNPDYPKTTPKGGTGKGIWIR